MTATPTRAPATWNHDRFERNAAALAELQPALARRLADLQVSDTVMPAWGRDGVLTFRVLGTDHRHHWLGRTSMPSISAPAVLEHFDPGGANALIPQMGTGLEADLSCRRLPSHCAVFAFDPDPLNIKLALYVADLAEHFHAGRLVLLAFEPLQVALPAFIEKHSGCDLPRRILVHPAVPQEAFDQVRVASEAAAAVVEERNLRTARDVAAVLAERSTPTVGD